MALSVEAVPGGFEENSPLTAQPSAHLELRRLCKRYDGAGAPAVDDVSFSVARGEMVGLLGPSGCGKTTTLRMVAGFVRPTSGDILLDGLSIVDVPPHRRPTSMVFQSYALFPHLTVAENIGFGLRIRKMPAQQISERVASLLELISLPDVGARLPEQLSGGQQQRVALARSLAVQPDLILLDEPLSNLDAKLRRELRVHLRQILRSIGVTALFVTHDQAEALSMCDNVVVMSHGRVLQVAEPATLYRSPATRGVAEFVGESNLLPGTLERVDAAGQGTVRVELAGRSHNMSARCSPGVTAGARGEVLIRPEAVQLDAHRAGGELGLAGRITDVDYLGSIVDYLVDLAGSSIRVKMLAGASVHALGEEVRVRWSAEDALFLPADRDENGAAA